MTEKNLQKVKIVFNYLQYIPSRKGLLNLFELYTLMSHQRVAPEYYKLQQ